MLYCLALLCTVINIDLAAFFCCLLLKGNHNFLFLSLMSFFTPVVLIFLDLAGISGILESHPLRTLLLLLFFSVLLHFCFSDYFIKKILILATGFALQALCTFLIAYPLASLGFFEAAVTEVALTPQFLIAQYLGALCYLFFILLFVKIIRKRSLNDTHGWSLLLLFISVQSFLLVTIHMGLDRVFPMELMLSLSFVFILCIIVDLAMFYVIEDTNKKIALEETARFYQTQLSMQLELYDHFSAYSENLLKTKQQITSILSKVQNSLLNRNYRAAEELLDPLPCQLSRLRTIHYCNNSVANALLFIWHRRIKQLNIHFEYHLQIDDDCFIEKSDLCRILSNLLDNAIEACQTFSPQQKSGEPQIRLICLPVKNGIVIRTQNSFSGTLCLGQNRLPVSKKKGAGHGRGLAGVREIAGKYGGTLLIRENAESRLISISVLCLQREKS